MTNLKGKNVGFPTILFQTLPHPTLYKNQFSSSQVSKVCSKCIYYIHLHHCSHSPENVIPLWDHRFSSVQSPYDSATPRTTACQASLSITNSWSLPKVMFITWAMPCNHLILCRPVLLPSIFSSIKVFSNELVLHIRGPNYWSFSFSINPSNEYSGLISFKMDCLDLLAVQGTLKRLLQHHSSRSINSLALSFLYSPTLTSIHDYWKNNWFD